MSENMEALVGEEFGWRLYVSQTELVLRRSPTRSFSSRGRLEDDPTGDRLFAELESLSEQGYGDLSSGTYRLEVDVAKSLDPEQREFLGWFCPSLPCSLVVSHRHSLGHPEFQLDLDFRLGGVRSYPELIGVFARLEGSFYILTEEVWQLLDEVAALNAMTAEEKSTLPKVLRRWQSVDSAAGAADAEVDRYLREERVVTPSSVRIDVAQDDHGNASIVPSFEGVSADEMRHAYLIEDDIQDIYNVNAEAGGRVRVVISEDVKPVLEAVRQYRRLPPAEQAAVFSRPEALFPDEIDAEAVDLSLFGPRVREIGEYPVSVRVFSRASRDWAQTGDEGPDDGTVAEEGSDEPGSPANEIGIAIEDAAGDVEIEEFENSDEVEILLREVERALAMNEPIVAFRGRALPVSERLRDQLAVCLRDLQRQEKRVDERDSGDAPAHSDERGSGLVGPLVWGNEDAPEYEEGEREASGASGFAMPNALRKEIELKPHQKHGVNWLARNVADGKRGALLADDMGLGKTLQVLTFLAWLIENDGLKTGLDRKTGPWDPILIVSPVILLEVWRDELEKFFEPSTFLPYEVLDSAGLRKFKISEGREGKLAKSVLDLEGIRQHRIVISNYDAVANYGFSFGQIRWSAVVTDESHHFKEPSTRVSQVMKSLNTEFRVAMTGTPVVNRLMDVWNIVDFLRPLWLGSQKEFRDEFEPRDDDGGPIEGARRLQSRLRVSTSPPIPADCVVLRRAKEQELPGLPRKIEHRIDCPISEEQRSEYRRIQALASAGAGKGVMFKVLGSMNQLLQHPALQGLVPLEADPSELLATGPKLKALVEQLRVIRDRGEKVLVFAILVKMQNVLKRVLDHEFGLNVKIINGQSQSAGKNVRRRRQELIEDFSSAPGFDVMVLSPDVAGVGLTITAANNVFHFGRWWNPAREDQATDRTHRIGQERDVHVYRLISVDERGAIKTFDEHLDDLISERRQTSDHFLIPSIDDGEATQNLGGRIFVDEDDGVADSALVSSTADLERMSPDRFEAFVGAWLEKQGFDVFVTPYTGDAGVDVVGIDHEGPVYVQVKHVQKRARKIPEDAVQQVRNGASHYLSSVMPPQFASQAPREWVVTNGRLASSTQRRSREFGVATFDGRSLIRDLKRVEVMERDVTRLNSQRSDSLQKLRELLLSRYPEI